LGASHAPTGIDDKEDQVRCAADADLSVHIVGQDRKTARFALALDLLECCLANGSVESDVAQVAVGRAGLDVATSLAIGAGCGSFSGGSPRKSIHGGLDTPGAEYIADRHNEIDLLGSTHTHGIGHVPLDGRANVTSFNLAGLGSLVTRQFFFFP
jgi:hypothetical protein